MLIVRPHASEDNEVLLAALERVNGVDFEIIQEILTDAAQRRKRIDQVRNLAEIRSNDADLCGANSGALEAFDQTADRGSLPLIDKRCPRTCVFFD